ncbi:MAG: mechanosensitive ion channel [Gammaproteobacteria bacterium]|nr:mechanosensitive ion channel [Gammaproteobacteria bacterium]NIV49646.1 mechanosensitive ion channel [Gammaproteobacteria bacterium]NIW57044.1 mechanosensitive ion channel [Gammaproteobacteria bacterium]
MEQWMDRVIALTIEWSTSPQFYAQCAAVVLAIVVSYSIARLLLRYAVMLREEPRPGPLFQLRQKLYQAGDLLFPLLNILALGIAVEVSNWAVQESWLVRMAQGVAVIYLLYGFVARFVTKALLRKLITMVGIPIALLHVFGWLDEVVGYLDSIRLHVGNIELSVYSIVRVLLFGAILFWLGRISNATGQKIIRRQEDLDVGTREVFAKLFEVTVFFVVFLLLLQVMGINLTALAVFGGALGVGLGFGLQSIASNFISGIIILLDRSVTVGDHVELEDGRSGIIRQMSMRSTTLETFDGKDIIVPNEKFITSNIVNWTHNNKKQRYSLHFSVAYSTDLHRLFEIVREVVAGHPLVLSGDDLPIEERPDAEIESFGDSGINILVEFWMEGIDDGKNRVGADLLLMIWDAMRKNDITIPFPQREVRVLNLKDASSGSSVD